MVRVAVAFSATSLLALLVSGNGAGGDRHEPKPGRSAVQPTGQIISGTRR